MKLADFMLNTNTPSKVRLCFLKQISFHFNLLYNAISKSSNQFFACLISNGR